jgi:hypothetical protein
LTARQGRRFGLTVGGAFLVLAAAAWWRGHPASTATLGALGGALAIAGLLIPTYLGPVERGWMRLAQLTSKVTTPIVMAVMYLLVITPIGLARRAFGGNAMHHKAIGASYWRSRAEGSRAGNLRRQF